MVAHRPFSAFVALTLACVLAAPANAQLSDAQLVAGHAFEGQLDSAADTDIVVLEGLAGEVVTL